MVDQGTGALIDLLYNTFKLFDPGDVDDQGIEEGALLGSEDRAHRLLIRCIGAEAVDRLGGEGDQPSGGEHRPVLLDEGGVLCSGIRVADEEIGRLLEGVEEEGEPFSPTMGEDEVDCYDETLIDEGGGVRLRFGERDAKAPGERLEFPGVVVTEPGCYREWLFHTR